MVDLMKSVVAKVNIADSLVALLPRRPGHGLFNPWTQKSVLDLATDAVAKRMERLRRHFDVIPRLVLVGEAAGYQGCRFSGIPFTSERLLGEGSIPRILRTGRFTSRQLPFSEPSATIIWRTLFELGLAESTVLWNALPLHPFPDGKELGNRTPLRTELTIGLPCLEFLSNHFSGLPVVAVGLQAEKAMRQLGVEPTLTVRHPANGGATKFATAMRTFAKRLDVGK